MHLCYLCLGKTSALESPMYKLPVFQFETIHWVLEEILRRLNPGCL